MSWGKGRLRDQRRMQQAVYKVRTAGTAHATALYTLAQSCIFCCSQGQGAGKWGLESGPKEGKLVVKRDPEGTGVTSSTTRKVFRRNTGCYRIKVPSMSGTRRPLSPRHWTTRKFLAQGNISQCELHQRSPSPSSIQLPVGSSAGHFMPNNQQDGNTVPLISRHGA